MMKFAVWLSLIGIVTTITGGAMLLSAVGDERHATSHAPYVLLAGVGLIFVPWAFYGVSVVVNIGTYFR